MTASKQHLSEDEAVQIRLAEARALLKNDDERHFLRPSVRRRRRRRHWSQQRRRIGRIGAHGLERSAPPQGGEIRIALLEGGDAQDPETVVVAVNDDRPFLFDSALAAAIAAGARIRMAFHPLLDIAGKPTSVIVLVVDAIAEGAARIALQDGLNASFVQGRDAVRDWKAMLARLKQTRDGLATHPPKGADITEDLAFLDWLGDNHFTFLGARDYALTPDGEHGRMDPVAGSGLGALSDEEARVIRQSAERPALTGDVRAYLDQPEPLIVTKSNARSLVHRRAHMDYIGVKTFDEQGRIRWRAPLCRPLHLRRL